MQQLELFEDDKKEMRKSVEKILNSMKQFQDAFQKAMDEIEQEQEQFWKSLSQDDQLKAFCAVVRRIHQGEIIDKGSYRHVLYGVFGFDSESYAQAQHAGYLDIHNSIVVNEENR